MKISRTTLPESTHSSLRLAPADGARLGSASLVESRQYLADAAMRDEKLARDVTWPYAHQRHLDDTMSHVIRKWAAIDEYASQLVDPGLT